MPSLLGTIDPTLQICCHIFVCVGNIFSVHFIRFLEFGNVCEVTSAILYVFYYYLFICQECLRIIISANERVKISGLGYFISAVRSYSCLGKNDADYVPLFCIDLHFWRLKVLLLSVQFE